MPRRWLVVAALNSVIALRALAWAADDVHEQAPAAPPAWPRLSTGPLQDNSFFLEEAYNQEAGVVQHIGTALRDQRTHRWAATFTQEWPLFGATHQLSYLVPYEEGGDGEGESGAGDVLLNYRYQLLFEGPRRPACAPRVSLILPTRQRAQGPRDRLGGSANQRRGQQTDRRALGGAPERRDDVRAERVRELGTAAP